MESKHIAETLLCGFNYEKDDVVFTTMNPSAQRKLVVAALLELYKAEALGSTSPISVHNNLEQLSEHVEKVLTALNTPE